MATSLVNTAPEVRRSTGEALRSPGDLARFLDEHGLSPGPLKSAARPTGDDLRQVHALRGEIRDIMDTHAEDHAVDAANGVLARAGSRPVLLRNAEDGPWQWHVVTSQQASLAEELAVLTGAGMLGVIHTLSHSRFRACTSSTCEGMFIDTSRAGRRRYCTPDVCGNRLNVANHRARRRAGA
ncbi:CGNR zinc finger domain-containing protein [Streptomyces abyssalis]|uniref:CGNR zinc finger domain-containing protein n=1 Tax=Streptomyces abyssalis TaxID=933944 RepID=UPI001FE14E33|nr:CGNR zinc finger domain-containing protein [Streptomyces abyssalis]